MKRTVSLFLAAVVLLGFSLYLNCFRKDSGVVPGRRKEAAGSCLQDQQYYDLGRALENPENVCFLQLGGLTSLPPEIKKFKNLREVHFGATNHLAVLPPEIGELANLRVLDMSFNEDLEDLPPELFRLTKLEEMKLTGNKLTRIPEEIGLLVNLRVLRLESNRLVCLPSEIGRLSRLEDLRLGGNRLLMLPPEITELTGLKTLSIYHNPLVLDQTPPEFLSRRYYSEDAKVYQEEIETFKSSAERSEGITHLARKIISDYLAEIDFEAANPLTSAQKICLEDHLQNRTGYEELLVGETRTFSATLLKEAFAVCKIRIKNICQ